jgi:hypothetical protein
MNGEPDFFRTGNSSNLGMHGMWVHIAVCRLVAPNVGLLAMIVGPSLLLFARIAGWKLPLFASPSLTVCEPLHIAIRLGQIRTGEVCRRKQRLVEVRLREICPGEFRLEKTRLGELYPSKVRLCEVCL